MSALLARAFPKALLITLALLAACGDSNPILEPPPPVAVASVAVNPPTQSLIVGNQLTLEAKPKAANGQDLERTVTWTSENQTLATVSSSGVVIALAPGEVGIRATSEGKFGRSVITIEPLPPVPVAEVRLSASEEIVLEWDGSAAVSAKAYDAQGNELADRLIAWGSSAPSIASVVDGHIEAQNPGTAVITATAEEISASITVRVRQAPIVALTLEAATTGLEVGDAFIFSALIERANGDKGYGPVTWSSNLPAVGAITHTDVFYAVVEARAEGAFTLTAEREGKTTSMTLTVTAKPTHDLVYNRWLGSASEIFVMSTWNTSDTPAKINAGNVSREPSPSPDGSQIVFAVSQLTPMGEQQHDLYIVNRNGMNMRWLTRTGGVEQEPKWSPDGARILFTGIVDGRSDLYVINPDGTGLTNLTSAIDHLTNIRHPAWSRDGNFIAFTAAAGTQHAIYLMNGDGSNVRQITVGPFDAWPSFSPDGQKIAFVRYNSAAPAFGDDIVIVNVNGGLTTRYALPGDQRTPSWSPDGRFIALSGTAVAGSGIVQIYTMRPDGTGLRLRTVDPTFGGGVWPSWIARP